MTHSILIAGFGGQGVLFAGKFIAKSALVDNKNVSWLPSYGPEMRGGTCNCSVIVSDEPIGCPIVTKPNELIVFNLPSLEKFENDVVPGGKIFVDSSLIDKKVTRKDVEVFYVPTAKLAELNALPDLPNMILMGKVIKETNVVTLEAVDSILSETKSSKPQHMNDFNVKAVHIGYDY